MTIPCTAIPGRRLISIANNPMPATASGELRLASEEYQWGFALVAAWSSHLDPADGTLWDISPGNIGNVAETPQTFAEYQEFYNLLEGGDAGQGHPLNPHTGQPYEEQWVPRGDYTRVLAEFWADGPETETPTGPLVHHPQLRQRSSPL